MLKNKIFVLLIVTEAILSQDSSQERRFPAAGGAPQLSAAYRKDAYLQQYIEFGVPEPINGGRLHIIGSALDSGTIGTVNLNGTILNMSTGLSPSSWEADWVRVEPATGLVKGSPFWISLHSRLSAWDNALTSGSSSTIVVTSNNSSSVLVSGTFQVEISPVRVMWVTTARSGVDVYLYLKNFGNTPSTVSKAYFCGIDITSLLPASVHVVPAGQMEVWVVPANILGKSSLAGTVWTLSVQWVETSISETVGGGLFWRELFPIETWPHGSDCPFPGVNDTAYALHRAHGIDTFFTEYHLDSACKTNITAVDLVNTIAPQAGFFVFPSFENGGTPFDKIKNESSLAGIFLADEDDTVVDDKARILLARVLEARNALPSQPTYGGGASNRYTGAYAGITDIKGMDAYIGACAPHYAL